MLATAEIATSKNYDYIVPGGRTAGVRIAARLTEDPNVSDHLVIQAGGSHLGDAEIRRIMSDGSHFKNAQYDWGLETLVALVGPETTDKIIGADNVVWCLDIDGTLTAPGKELAPAILALLNSIRDHVVLITAQAMDYCDTIHASSFPNLVTEKGMVRRINGTMRTEDASPEVPGFIQEMRELLGKIVDRNPTLVPVFNVKTAGYAVGDENLTTEERVRVLTLMQAQEGRANSELYIVEQTAGFIDITFARLSKASSLREAMTQFPGGTPIACGDSANTDGPMLDEAEKLGGTGIMVSKTRAGFVTVADHNKMIEVLRLYGEIVSA